MLKLKIREVRQKIFAESGGRPTSAADDGRFVASTSAAFNETSSTAVSTTASAPAENTDEAVSNGLVPLPVINDQPSDEQDSNVD